MNTTQDTIGKLSGAEIKVAANGYLVRPCGEDDPLFQCKPYVFATLRELSVWLEMKLESLEA